MPERHRRAAQVAAEKNSRHDEYLAALWAAWVCDETDAAEGGVPPQAVAERAGISRPAASGCLAQLVDEGYARTVRGIGGTPVRPRTSYVPVDRATADTGGDA